MSDKQRLPENMTTKLNIVLIGGGEMSKYLEKSIQQKGASVVGVFDVYQPDLADQLSKLEINCIVITASIALQDIQFALATFVRNSMSVVVACNWIPHLSAPCGIELDRLAKINYCTVLEVGYMRGTYCPLIEDDNLQDKEDISNLIVDRIVDCINSPSGFISKNLLEPARRYNKPLNEYILI